MHQRYSWYWLLGSGESSKTGYSYWYWSGKKKVARNIPNLSSAVHAALYWISFDEACTAPSMGCMETVIHMTAPVTLIDEQVKRIPFIQWPRKCVLFVQYVARPTVGPIRSMNANSPTGGQNLFLQTN